MPSQLGGHIFISPFFLSISYENSERGKKREIHFTWGVNGMYIHENEEREKENFHIKCAHNHMHKWNVSPYVYYQQQHTRNKVKKEIFLPFFRLFSESDRYAWKMYQNLMSNGS
jgi:hypothetical protein